MREFSPHLEILPPAQRRLWTELSGIPADFVLYGGTALALHLGHRESADFDFFSNRSFDVRALEKGIAFLAGAQILQRTENTLTAVIERGGPAKISFFGLPELTRLRPAHVAKDNSVQVASLLDLAGTKASVVQARAEARDYIDLDALMRLGGISLSTALAAAGRIYGPSFNAQITLKALSYFDDGNLPDLPEPMKLRLVAAAREVDLDHLPAIEHAGRDAGRELEHDS
jgi:hypothetical protein